MVTERKWHMQGYYLLIKALHSDFTWCFENPPLTASFEIIKCTEEEEMDLLSVTAQKLDTSANSEFPREV